MTPIKFGTDGWRAIIAKDFTVDNVTRVAEATAKWMKERNMHPSVVVGHDCRFGGELFAETVALVMCRNNIRVKLAKGFVSTPMVSLGAKAFGADLGVIITASHNPPSYNGYKLKGGFGGPASTATISEVEELIPEKAAPPEGTVPEFVKKGLIEYVDLESLYIEHVRKNFDLKAIEKSGLVLAYDAMYGAGQNVIKKILPDAILLHCDYNPSFKGIAPEPLDKNLQEFSQLIKESSDIDAGLATDGDADRLAMYDEKGNYVDAHHLILLLVHYLHKHRKMSGKVVIAFSVSNKVKKLCEIYGLPCQVTKIGFKYICEIMMKEDVLVGGEESGGIAVKGHIPERDGIWDGLVILEYMAKSGKSVTDLIKEVYAVVGPFSYERNDLHLTEELKQKIITNCKKGKYKAFGANKITRVEEMDGYKFYFGEDETVMLRASGTEPVLRVYVEAPSKKRVHELLKAAEETLMK
ncbi:MAG TPA: phosphoglucomutase/phosphomannomutase family protein [Chitinophagales bacterium]|nr:phosphoglucomutase/phosphomannomutase family protein [Chitinophagales bacterium]